MDPVTRAVLDVLVELHQPDAPGHSMSGEVAALREDAERIAAAARSALAEPKPPGTRPLPGWLSRFELKSGTGLELAHLDCAAGSSRLFSEFGAFAEAGDTLADLVTAVGHHRCVDEAPRTGEAGGPQ
ncbi:hypothetical protein HNR23_002304 [Nocardiopsis mwathae]|uniref:Uncharacterized protein n=1 Tax=Nocardiopsis mwathae TaxID=1472723 RepID=A0A7W9YHM4_9ACTN|nr:hypothetical protein [Nocardiopsis mwathae]MBB6172244.1 hypothetical protein [Nocardiopsis mwathae]